MGSAAFLGPHAVFIVGSYAVTTIVVVVLVLWVWLDGRRQARLLADLEARGVRRRSAEAPTATAPGAAAAVKEPAA
ncbi:heme exporter protein CcmD [Rhodoplanes sp. SY1]|uniref:heme exporter protein CcmD n=1 Tax=Rhodoplanes sp. SY1 TaxID=3166646 RepID=UPI0038B4FD54